MIPLAHYLQCDVIRHFLGDRPRPYCAESFKDTSCVQWHVRWTYSDEVNWVSSRYWFSFRRFHHYGRRALYKHSTDYRSWWWLASYSWRVRSPKATSPRDAYTIGVDGFDSTSSKVSCPIKVPLSMILLALSFACRPRRMPLTQLFVRPLMANSFILHDCSSQFVFQGSRDYDHEQIHVLDTLWSNC